MYALCNRGPGCCDPGCCGPGCCAARFRRGCAAASRSDGRGRSAPGARVPHSSFRGGVAEPGIHGVRRLAGKPNPMDSRFRGNDGVIQGFSRSKWIPAFAGMTAFSSGIGKLFVMPGRQVIRHSRVGTLFVISESASYSSFRGGVAEPGIHGVCRLAGKPNPMDSRFRGNDGLIQSFLK